MFCANCGNKLPDDAKFCDACGAQVMTGESAQEPPREVKSVMEEEPKGSKVTENICLGTDGKYHWYYELKLMKNPTILFVLWKIFFWIFVGMWVFLSIINSIQGHFNMKDFLDFSKIFLLILVGVEALVAISYFLYAAMQGFKYCVLFEMDGEGVKHTQMPRQFKKAQAISLVLILAGMATKNPGAVGQGMLAGAKNSIVSSFSHVKSIEIFRKRNVIKVNERLNKNQVYACDQDFDFVVDFIKSQITKKCKVYEK